MQFHHLHCSPIQGPYRFQAFIADSSKSPVFVFIWMMPVDRTNGSQLSPSQEAGLRPAGRHTGAQGREGGQNRMRMRPKEHQISTWPDPPEARPAHGHSLSCPGLIYFSLATVVAMWLAVAGCLSSDGNLDL